MKPREKDPAAVALGRKGGQARSEAKARASRANGRKGGARKAQNPPPRAQGADLRPV